MPGDGSGAGRAAPPAKAVPTHPAFGVSAAPQPEAAVPRPPSGPGQGMPGAGSSPPLDDTNLRQVGAFKTIINQWPAGAGPSVVAPAPAVVAPSAAAEAAPAVAAGCLSTGPAPCGTGFAGAPAPDPTPAGSRSDGGQPGAVSGGSGAAGPASRPASVLSGYPRSLLLCGSASPPADDARSRPPASPPLHAGAAAAAAPRPPVPLAAAARLRTEVSYAWSLPCALARMCFLQARMLIRSLPAPPSFRLPPCARVPWPPRRSPSSSPRPPLPGAATPPRVGACLACIREPRRFLGCWMAGR